VEIEDRAFPCLWFDPGPACALSGHRSPGRQQGAGQPFQISISGEGFFLEAHLKLRPVDFASDGLYLCGVAHYPKTINETIAQAEAAAARSATILSKEHLLVGDCCGGGGRALRGVPDVRAGLSL